jgi:predicted DCC family thiol-disulfide oxidoreductase YuxK
MDAVRWVEEVEAQAEASAAAARLPRALTVLFDPACALCQRSRDWMLRQESYVTLRFVACSGEEARARYGDIPWLGDELVVVSDSGEVWAGPAAFLTCLWALVAWREWSYRLSGGAFAPLAERFFRARSSKRRSIAALFDHECTDGACQARVSRGPRRRAGGG